MNRLTVGRFHLFAIAVVDGVGGFFAGWNITHIYNAHWPPRPMFPNGQTLATSAFLVCVR